MTETPGAGLRDQIVACLPNLRAFARTIAKDPNRADDLVQDTLVKALANLEKFQPGTNLVAWLFTILRNHFYTESRNRRREVEDADGGHAAGLVSEPRQIANLEMGDFQKALADLPVEQREALVLVGGAGFSYEDAAEICGCAVGTIKSRVNRARARLNQVLDPEAEESSADNKDADQPCPKAVRIAGASG
jgi:RNA polymerase sigma-70 factor (ECF subfamily)